MRELLHHRRDIGNVQGIDENRTIASNFLSPRQMISPSLR
jgi:hypothetical protein